MAEKIVSDEFDSRDSKESTHGHFSGSKLRHKSSSQPSLKKYQHAQNKGSHKGRRRKSQVSTSSDSDGSSGDGSCKQRLTQPSQSISRKGQNLKDKGSHKGCRRKGQVSTSSDSDSSSGDEVKAALESHYSYLRKNMTVDNELAAKLYGWSPQLLGDPPYREIRSLNNQGRQYDAFEKWFNFATSYYTQESVGMFCKCLKEAGREGRPRLTKVARKTLKKVPSRGCPDSPPLSSGNSPQPSHEKISNPHVEKLREHACDQYKLLKVGDGIKMEYIKLTLLPTDPTVREENRRNLNDSHKHYRTCGIEPLETDSTVEPTELLRKAKSKVRVVYGHAGIGKTSLLKQICCMIVKRKAVTDYELILYFPLREELVSQAKTLRDLLSYYGSEDESLDYSKVVQSLIDNKGREVLIFFDGADEVREMLEFKDTSAFTKILHGKVLPEASVIVTSRPGGIPNLQKLTPEFYEIRGFDKASIKSYITEFFKDHPEEGVKMLEELLSRADLFGGAHIPVNLFIFCSVYSDQCGFPATITLCYEYFTCHVMSMNSQETFHFEPSFQFLPHDEQKLLEALGNLAYQGLLETPPVFVFKKKYLHQVCPSLFTADKFMDEAFFRGLLHQDSCKRGGLLSSTYNFSHTTNQEFFAAVFLSKLPEDKQIDFLAKNFTNPKYSMVVRFYSGLTGLSSERITSFLCRPNHQSPSSHALSSLHSLCRRDCTWDNPQLLFLCHSLHESQNSLLTENIAVKYLSDSLTFGLSLTPHDFLVLRYTLGRCTHLRELRFYKNYIPSFCDIFPIISTYVVFLEVHVESLSLDDGRNVSSMKSLEGLDLTVGGSTTISALSAIFSSSTINYLILSIPEIDITHEHKSELSHIVSANTTLKTLTLHGPQDCLSAVLHVLGTSAGSITDLVVRCNELSVEDGRNLSSMASLETLYLDKGGWTTLSALSAIFSSSTIKEFHISFEWSVTDITHEHKSELSRVLSANTALKKLTLRADSPNFIPAILHVLGTSTESITDLNVWCDDFSEEDGRNLSSVASLETLHLTVTRSTTLSAVSAIYSSSTLKDLCLTINCPVADITHEHKSELSRVLSANTTWKKLTLCRTSSDLLTYMSPMNFLRTSAGSITDLDLEFDELSVEDGRNLSSVASLETLDFMVQRRTTLSALSAIFSSSTIKELRIHLFSFMIDITHEHKSELGRLVSANTTLKKLTLFSGSQEYMSAVLHVISTSAGSITYLVVSCDNFSVEDGRNLSNMASLETLNLTVRENTALSALSAIFSSSTIKNLLLRMDCPLTDITHEHKSELSRLVSANTTLKKLSLTGSQDYMSAVLHVLGTSAGSITDLDVSRAQFSVEGHRDVAEALATTCAVNTNLKRVVISRLPPLPVMRSLTNRKATLDGLVIMYPLNTFYTHCYEDFLEEMKRAAAEIEAMMIVFDVDFNPKVCGAVSAGFGRNPFLKDLTLWDVPRQMEESAMTELSESIEAVRMLWS